MEYITEPNQNGILELDEEMIIQIKAELEQIASDFVPSIDMPVLSTHYVVSVYNLAHPGEEINGDTAEYILSYGG